MSTRRIRRIGHYEGLCFCISSCPQKKGVLCSQCDDQSFLKLALHLPLGSVYVWSKYKNKLWEQFR